jgi:rhomboid protease GluP
MLLALRRDGSIAMATKSFGRRGLAPQVQAAAPRFAAMATPSVAVRTDTDEAEDNLFLAYMPILTVGLIMALFVIFGLEQRFSFDADKGAPGDLSLIAFGAAGYDFVVGSGEVWRVFLAPLLHANFTHFLGNAIALFFVGVKLEPLVGRGWFAGIFVLAALGGIAGSLLGNPHAGYTVGASGAITGLIAALFVVSFHHRAAQHDQSAMRKTALRFGVPALGPLLYSATGHTDYHAHLGGAVAGAACAALLCGLWSEGRFRPDHARTAAWAACVGVAASVLACVLAAHGFEARRMESAELVPNAAIRKSLSVGDARSAELLARYPNDPLAHLVRGFALVEKNRFVAAEFELRTALAMPDKGPRGTTVRRRTRILLAAVLAEEGQHDEARRLAGDLCGESDAAEAQTLLRKEKVCD